MTEPSGTPTSNVIEAEGLTKVFKDFWYRPKVEAVNHLSLSIRSGEVFGLLGPNGSGKSTTLKMILGLLQPTSGSLSVLGAQPSDVETKNRIGYLPEETYLYPYLTAEETMDFYGRLFNIPQPTRRERVAELLDLVDLTYAAKRQIGEFSKGMARRVGLAQALVNDPDLVILDEPTSGLDPIGCRQIKDLILLLSKRGKTVLLSSHLLADVEDVCDRITILYNGNVKAAGPINELLEERNLCRINMPELPPEDLKRILKEIRDVMGSEPDVEHPRRNLEQFFLEVVEKAKDNQSTGTPS